MLLHLFNGIDAWFEFKIQFEFDLSCKRFENRKRKIFSSPFLWPMGLWPIPSPSFLAGPVAHSSTSRPSLLPTPLPLSHWRLGPARQAASFLLRFGLG